MKKILILSILIAPVAAYATGPAGVENGFDGDWVGADDGAPYITATEQPGDSTTVVSASYVKGAYNDTIAAINTVAADVNGLYDSLNDLGNDKQDKLYSSTPNLIGGGSTITYINTEVKNTIETGTAGSLDKSHLASVGAIRSAIDAKRISAVTTWGDDTATKLELTNR